MAFEFGMFHEFQRPAGISDEEAFATSFEQVDAAERWGLDAMWLAEIHVAPERSVLSAPLTAWAGTYCCREVRQSKATRVMKLLPENQREPSMPMRLSDDASV